MARKIIVGVVGGSNLKDGDPTLTLASAIGTACAGLDVIMMTGGKPQAGTSRVHERAMFACGQANGRMIAILPRALSPPSCTIVDKPRHLQFQTALTSMQRNPITGAAVDALIVLDGGAGTLVEVACAAASVQPPPIVFYGSHDKLRSAFRKHSVELTENNRNENAVRIVRGEVEQGIANIVEMYGWGSWSLLRGLESILDGSRPRSVFEAGKPAETVLLAALRQVSRGRDWETDAPTRFQGHAAGGGVPKDGFKGRFEELVRDLSR